jgi:hypothetical protein
MQTTHNVGRSRILLLLLIGALSNIAGVVSASDVANKNIRFDMSSSIATKRHRMQRFGLNDLLSPGPISHQSKKLALSSIFKYRAGSEPTPSLLSKCLFVLNQTINGVTAAIVGSGFLGSWIASLIICKVQNRALSSLNSSDTEESVSPLFSVINRKWILTILSSGMYLILRAIYTGAIINSLSVVGDIGFLLTLWLFSSVVDPVDGGLIGCSYVSLEAIASFVSSRAVVNAPSQLMKFRLTPLDDEANLQLIEKAIQSEPTNLLMEEILAHALSSVSMLASQPQYFLSMHLLSSSILHWMTMNDDYKGLGFVSWFEAELPNTLSESGHGRSGVRAWALSIRLFTLHVLVMAIKGVAAFVLL